MTEEGAKLALNDVLEVGGPVMAGTEAGAGGVSDGRHAAKGLLSAADAELLGKFAKGAGAAGDVYQLGTAAWHYAHGVEHKNEELFGALGGWGGGAAAAWGTAAVLGSFTGPWTTAAVVGLAAYLGSEVGESAGGQFGSQFDTASSSGGG